MTQRYSLRLWAQSLAWLPRFSRPPLGLKNANNRDQKSSLGLNRSQLDRLASYHFIVVIRKEQNSLVPKECVPLISVCVCVCWYFCLGRKFDPSFLSRLSASHWGLFDILVCSDLIEASLDGFREKESGKGGKKERVRKIESKTELCDTLKPSSYSIPPNLAMRLNNWW